ncbi:hypothetical protein Taro_042165, partial [Colocasia esculenta]|nr:hypothetical protein [Colocasia esculenta]
MGRDRGSRTGTENATELEELGEELGRSLFSTNSPPLGLPSWSSNLLARARAGHGRFRIVRPRMTHTLTRKGMIKSEARSTLESLCHLRVVAFMAETRDIRLLCIIPENANFGKSLKRALGDAVLATFVAQTCADFPPAFVNSVTWLVTMVAVALGWSVGYEDLQFHFLAGSLCDVEGTLLDI